MFDAMGTRAFELPRPIKACPEVDSELDGLTYLTRSLARQIGKSVFGLSEDQRGNSLWSLAQLSQPTQPYL